MSLEERLEALKQQGLVASWRLGEEPRAPIRPKRGGKPPRRKLYLKLTPRMFPADEADFDPDLGEQLGEALREIAAEFGVAPEVLPPPARPKVPDRPKAKVFTGRELQAGST